MVPPTTVRKLAAAVALLATGLLVAGSIGPVEALAVGAFAVGAVGARSGEFPPDFVDPFAAVPVVLLLLALALGGFGDVIGTVALVVAAGAAGAITATV